jgi:hypothetical protein
VLKATVKSIAETKISLTEPLRIASIPTNRENRLKNRHCTSIRKLLERIRCHGLKANSAAAKSPDVLVYIILPIPYTKATHPSPNNVIKNVPLLSDNPKTFIKAA